ncbi:thrombospondin type 3 repeat-containing protein [Tichowtungia aerotolerans]|uniref:Uncharacterized protein n=1 Tax=Tichowtungia aerotolerans TaxID=2697043 RepID=A0A6P1M9J8_9BACT|nr:thrombospondin type 3 repeat-containing protein [Tichowtungia aerotolerans]QHI68748.1 hypothetical protein GT409_04550 [Tichowtungia aerotolerans]
MMNKTSCLTCLISLICYLAFESQAALTMNIDTNNAEFYFTGSDTGYPDDGNLSWSTAGWIDGEDIGGEIENIMTLFDFSDNATTYFDELEVVDSGIEIAFFMSSGGNQLTVTGKGSLVRLSYATLTDSEKHIFENQTLIPVEDGSGFSSIVVLKVTGADSPDSDNDGLSDLEESARGTNPNNPDTDGDGFPDGFEVDNGYSPISSDSILTDYIREHGEDFNLYSSNIVLNVAVGELLVSCSNQTAQLKIQLEQSEDLQAWTNAADAVQWSLSVDADKKFFKVKAQK